MIKEIIENCPKLKSLLLLADSDEFDDKFKSYTSLNTIDEYYKNNKIKIELFRDRIIIYNEPLQYLVQRYKNFISNIKLFYNNNLIVIIKFEALLYIPRMAYEIDKDIIKNCDINNIDETLFHLSLKQDLIPNLEYYLTELYELFQYLKI